MPRGFRRWGFRLATAVLVPASALVVVELALRLAGCGEPPDFFLPDSVPGMVRSNERFGWRFMPPALARAPCPVRFAARKPAGTFRVFLLGSSAAQGFPDPAYGPGRFFEVLLQSFLPTTRVEVINTAMTAVNSHGVRVVASECARYEPDLFVVYCGNNEVVGPYGPGTVLSPTHAGPLLFRMRIWLTGTRLGQLVRRQVERPPVSDEWGGMSMFAGHHVAAADPRLEGVYRRYRANLETVCAAGTSAGARVLLCTVPVNLADCPPLLSMDRHGRPGTGADTALACFLESQTARAEGRADAARVEAQQACDLDGLRFRADSRINAIVRSVAAAQPADRVTLVDADAALSMTGPEAFYEHVHLTPRGSWQMAALLARPLFPDREPLAYDPCAAALALAAPDEIRLREMALALISSPPFTGWPDHADRVAAARAGVDRLRRSLDPGAQAAALRLHEAALAARPDDPWLMEGLARAMEEAGDPAGAVRMLEAAAERVAPSVAHRTWLAQVRFRAGDRGAALQDIRTLARDLPRLPGPHKALGDLLVEVNETGAAKECYRRALAVDPGCVDAMINLAGLQMRDGAEGMEEAFHHLTNAVARADIPEARLNLGNWFLRSGRITEAIPHLQRAVEGRPSDASLRNNLGAALLGVGRRDEARRELEEALRLNPGHPKARRLLDSLGPR